MSEQFLVDDLLVVDHPGTLRLVQLGADFVLTEGPIRLRKYEEINTTRYWRLQSITTSESRLLEKIFRPVRPAADT